MRRNGMAGYVLVVDSDNIEKIAFLAPLLGMMGTAASATASAGGAVARGIGGAALSAGKKGLAGAKLAVTDPKAAFTAVKDKAKTALDATAAQGNMSGKQMMGMMGANIANQRSMAAQQSKQQQAAEQRQRATSMADKAKANASTSGSSTMKMLLQDIHDDLSLIKSLQLPSQLSEQLREDIMALDNNHEIVETGEETMVNNANPFMSEIIQRLYDKDNPVDEEEEKPAHVPQHLFY